MVEIKDTKPSKYIRDRARRCYVRRLSPDRFVVTPPEYPKPRRLVTLELDGDKMLANCQNFYNGEPCEANYYGGLCAHVQKAVSHAQHLAQRAESVAA